jgi:uncharacterized RDD family membrane protein YckC
MTGPGPTDPGGQAPPPPEPTPAAPDAAAPAAGAAQAGGQWGQQGQTPDWAKQAQGWRPAEVAAGPAEGITYADLTTRIIAFIIDYVIIGIVALVVNLVFGTLILFTIFTGGGVLFLLLAAIVLAVDVLLGAVYFIYTWTTMKASPGQRIMGLMTVSSADGSALTPNTALVRYLVMFAPIFVASFASTIIGGLIGFVLSFAGLAWVIFLIYTVSNDPKRQGYHDHSANSVVIKQALVQPT